MPEKERDIRYLLVFLIVALAFLIWIQNKSSSAIPNSGSVRVQHFSTENNSAAVNNQQNPQIVSNTSQGLQKNVDEKNTSTLENERIQSNIINKINQNEKPRVQFSPELDSLIGGENSDSSINNPLLEDINNDRNSLYSEQDSLDELIREINTGNDLIVNSPKQNLYRNKSRSINAANKYRNISYKDSEYRKDFDDDGSPSQASQDELNSLYDDSLVFRNNQYNTNGNFKGYSETSDNYGNANLNDFKQPSQQSQQEKIMALYNSNEYLPNNNLLDNKLTKGFQILDNPVSVSNPNLIPVLKSIPVSSVLGSNRNSTYDIRSEPPCPKTVVSPFLNSSIMPDIYSTNRGCL